MTRLSLPLRHLSPPPPWRWAVLGAALGLAGALLLQAPASWLAAAVQRASAGQVLLTDVRGTLWTGSARLVLSGGAGSRDSAALPGLVDWRVRPVWRGVETQLRADCCMAAPLQIRLLPRWRGATLQVADGASQWPAAVLAGLGTPWNTVQAEGQLALTTQGLSLGWAEGRMALAGRVELTAMGLSSRLSTLRPMGSYRLVLTPGAPASLALDTLEGGLQLHGSGQWVGSRLRFEGVASAVPGHEAALANLLNIIGRRDGVRSIITLG